MTTKHLVFLFSSVLLVTSFSTRAAAQAIEVTEVNEAGHQHSSHSSPLGLALGVILGDPTGLSGKMALDKTHSIDGALAWSGGAKSGIHIHATYLRDHGRVGELTDDMPLHLYYGIGGRLIAVSRGDNKGKLAIGPRAPIGLNSRMPDPSIEFFVEAALILDLVPGTSADADVGIGARYWF